MTIRLLLLMLLPSFMMATETFILSYRAQIKNAVVISESLYISESMKEIIARPDKHLQLETLPNEHIRQTLYRHKEKLIDFLMKDGLHTRSHETLYDYRSDSLICITIPPTYVTVDFKNDYAIITRLLVD